MIMKFIIDSNICMHENLEKEDKEKLPEKRRKPGSIKRKNVNDALLFSLYNVMK